ncbi:CBS domain-containing protein [Clostridium sp. AM58-1XD]|uniref:CBS domain-containing protein n=1 Tax=Clostridium sp. AM58-1XD TaxID=2292307 RepID=UPI000E47746E|nr:CBS domain-containing protein [Clostridium sp. AM58-1XD]RGY98388.1 CBS domain-containing protein [Clostridium sp. AM58-1XD]
MNILFFLTPKSEVAYIYEDETLRQALEKMEYHKYSSVPVINRSGRYIGTITEGDMLWGIKNKFNLNLKEAEGVPVTVIPRRIDYRPVRADAKMEDMVDRALEQNFIPVVDDQKNFIGIIRRKDIIKYFYDKLGKEGKDSRSAQGNRLVIAGLQKEYCS